MRRKQNKVIATRFGLAALILLLGQLALAMPCDTGYTCASKDGRYIVQLGSCRYTNHLSLQAVKADGVIEELATLGPAWDGKRMLAFEINIPTGDGSTHILSTERLKVNNYGELLDQSVASEPGPMTVHHRVAMKCIVSE